MTPPRTRPNFQPRTILLLGSQMETGGAQGVLLSQAQWFHEHGYQVTVAFLYDKENRQAAWQRQYAFPIINLKAKFTSSGKSGFFNNAIHFLQGFAALQRLMRRGQFEIIETFHHHCNLIGIPLAWLNGIPHRIATHHGHLHAFPAGLQLLHQAVIKSCLTDRYVLVSQALLDQSIRQHIPLSKSIVIPNGISQPTVPEAQIDALRRRLGLTPAQPVLLTAGRLAAIKGHSTLLQAMPAILACYPDTVLLIAGDGPLRTSLEAEARQLKVNPQVQFLGIRDDLPTLMRLASLFVLPSLQEGLPLVLLEAMSAGLTVLATAVGGVPEVIQHDQNGLLIPAGSPQELSAAVISFLGDNTRQARLAADARALVLKNYSLTTMCQRYEALWSQAEEQNPNP